MVPTHFNPKSQTFRFAAVSALITAHDVHGVQYISAGARSSVSA